MKNIETLIKEAMASVDSTQGLKEWAAANGATAQGATDAVNQVLTAAGHTGSIQDKWNSFLADAGYTGDLTNKLRNFWAEGGTVGGPPELVGSVRAGFTASPRSFDAPVGTAAGNMLILFHVSNSGTPVYPGYTQIALDTTNVTCALFARVATGTAADNVVDNVFASATQIEMLCVKNIAEPSVSFVEASIIKNNANPPLLTPSWGLAENFWYTGACDERTNAISSTVPSTYTTLGAPSYLETNNNRFISAYKIATAASDDPAAFTTFPTPWSPSVWTLAIRGAP